MEFAPKPTNTGASYARAVYDYIQSCGELGTYVKRSDIILGLPVRYPTIKWTPQRIMTVLNNGRTRGYFVANGTQWRLSSISEYEAARAPESALSENGSARAPAPMKITSYAYKLYTVVDALGPSPCTIPEIQKYLPTVCDEKLTRKRIKDLIQKSGMAHGYIVADGTGKYSIASLEHFEATREKRREERARSKAKKNPAHVLYVPSDKYDSNQPAVNYQGTSSTVVAGISALSGFLVGALSCALWLSQ